MIFSSVKMKYYRLTFLNKPFFIVSIALYISVYFNIKLISLNKCDDNKSNENSKKNFRNNNKNKQEVQNFKDAKVVIQNGDYFIPANVINGTENFGLSNRKHIFYNKKLDQHNPCNYGKGGPRVICAVFTHKEAHDDIIFIQNTWGRRCDKLLYMTGPKDSTTKDNPNIPFVYLNISDKYELITNKAIETMRYIYENHLNDFDWYLRANDDTYVIMENLKTFLAHKCPDTNEMYGKTLRYFMGPPFNDTFFGENIDKGFIQGGAGWLMSRGSLKLFIETTKKDQQFCVMKRGQLEDQEICNCFRKLNIFPAETRDDESRERFLMDKFEQLFSWPSQDQYRYSLNPIRLGVDCCSRNPIGFHNIKKHEHYKMEYLLYEATPHASSLN